MKWTMLEADLPLNRYWLPPSNIAFRAFFVSSFPKELSTRIAICLFPFAFKCAVALFTSPLSKY
jgi:hypothetical protein